MAHRATASVWLGDICFELSGTFYPGSPERAPAYAHGGLPADPAEFDIDSIYIGEADANEVWYSLEKETRTSLEGKALNQLEGE